MVFWITVILDRKKYSYLVEKQPSDESFDYYKVIAGNGVMKLKNNRPVFARHKLKHRKPSWVVESGGIRNAYLLELITAAIEEHPDR